ncbi:hypothetical protein PYJP_03690 [Pyrofollis japonicus]|uniref:chromatin protein Cren7 n=1 Tax=Pyrofollis japonicus TaxID=3060460 RepID=UPI00295AA07D|nr:chromatin protein Cren7 [Pyrofollis japonicus]BEP17017.1 hypothetical protein PYJP_03690 [Pyrofollis japonicus]
MPKRKDPYVCPRCGTRVDQPVKTWQLVSPIPDSKGRITITVMGSFVCPNCGYKWRAVISKIKVGGEELEVEAGGKKAEIKGGEKKEEKTQGEIIEIDLDEV